MKQGDPGLGPGAEFALIRRFLRGSSALPREVRCGPGDDAAVLEGGWVISTDLSVEDVHFQRAWMTEREIGARACVAALSDLAAMAAQPVGVLVSMAAPRGRDIDLEAVQAGVRDAAEAVGAAVIGGDVSRSPGPLFLDIVVLGRAEMPVQRDGAEAGDHVWVTGELGASAAAVRLWQEGMEPGVELRAAFVSPRPRIDAACRLVEHEVVDALIDLSDGLAGDAGHIAAASGVRITLESDLIPVAAAAVEALGPERALEAALHGGEDFELCFVTDPGVVDPDYFAEKFGLRLTRVGTVSAGSGVFLKRPGGDVHEVDVGGFDHWRED